jgi:hypothetical protein
MPKPESNMDTTNIREAVREKYGDAARRAKSGGSSDVLQQSMTNSWRAP